MFTFAMITGVKNGWLDRNIYGPAARKGWIAVVGYILIKAMAIVRRRLLVWHAEVADH